MGKKRTKDDPEFKELKKLEKGGILKPEDVVEFARNPRTALHSRFTWDDSAAAHQYRLIEARKLIEVYVEVIDNMEAPTRIYVSLSSDRSQPGGGYRQTRKVMSNAALRSELLQQALRELETWKLKYQTLEELAEVFVVAEKAKERYKNAPPKPKRKKRRPVAI